MVVYAERTLVVYKFMFNKRRHPDDACSIYDLDGESILTHFSKFLNSRVIPKLENENVKILRFHKIDTISEKSILASIESGLAGEDRVIYEPSTNKNVGNINAEQAALVGTRVYLSVENTGDTYAILCVEHALSSAGNTIVPREFANYLRQAAPHVTMKYEAVTEKEAEDTFKSVEQISIKYYIKQNDISDSLIKESDYVMLTYGHKKNRSFPTKILDAIRSKDARRKTLVGYEKSIFDNNDAVVEVQMKNKVGRIKKFKLNDDFDMRIVELLNCNGDKPLSDNEFVKRCTEKVEDISNRLGRSIL
jgi:hypothetical protein